MEYIVDNTQTHNDRLYDIVMEYLVSGAIYRGPTDVYFVDHPHNLTRSRDPLEDLKHELGEQYHHAAVAQIAALSGNAALVLMLRDQRRAAHISAKAAEYSKITGPVHTGAVRQRLKKVYPHLDSLADQIIEGFCESDYTAINMLKETGYYSHLARFRRRTALPGFSMKIDYIEDTVAGYAAQLVLRWDEDSYSGRFTMRQDEPVYISGVDWPPPRLRGNTRI